MSLSISEYLAIGALGLTVVQYIRNTTVTKEFSTLTQRVAIIESHPQNNESVERRVAVLESLHVGHGEQINGLKTEVGKMGIQLNELFRQVVSVQAKLDNNSEVFTSKFDQILRQLGGRQQ